MMPTLILNRLTQWIGILIVFISPALAAFQAYSNEELDQLEKEFIQQINLSPQVLRDPLAHYYLDHLGKRLSDQAEMDPPDFFLVQSEEINAFAGPGGHIGINTALILSADTESELGGVMAHEMAHVRLHHLYRMLEHQKQMKIPMLASMLASIALGVVNPVAGSGALMASLAGFAQNDINFVRSNEKEADRIGIDILYHAHLNPYGMAAFFKKMQQNSRYYYTDNIPAILRTHPMDEARIADAENRCAQMKPQSIQEDSHYPLFKELIRTSTNNDPKRLLDYYSRCLNTTSCRFGYALTLLQINRFSESEALLLKLLEQAPTNLYYVVSFSRAANANGHAQHALERLKALEQLEPDQKALLLSIAESQTAQNQFEAATHTLLQASRLFPRDVSLCDRLARAYAKNNKKGYAYFTAAQCMQLQGQMKEAKRLLKLADTYTQKDPLLHARIDAKLDESS